MNSYVARERLRHVCARERGLTPLSGMEEGMARGRNYPFVLPSRHRDENLAPALRALTAAYFERHRITWHTMAHHMLSSQICCINHLMPFATEPQALAALLEPVFGRDIEMLPILNDGIDRRPWYVGFEYAGQPGCDYLREGDGKPLTRGANCTSCDAVVRFRRRGLIETVLIEWKYTEAYGNHGPRSGDATRERRYRHLLEAPDSPVRPTAIAFGAFLIDPFYQFMRQQLLAREMEKAREMDSDIVRVLHIAPRANRAFHTVNVPAFLARGNTPVSVWRSLLVDEGRFVSTHTEDLFGMSVKPEALALLDYAHRRYGFTD